MIPIGPNGTLLFDGDCGICTSLSQYGRKIDAAGSFTIEPYQRYSEEELGEVGLDYRACGRSVQLILPSKRVLSGAFAVNGFLVNFFPWSLGVLLIYLLFPILLPLEILGYRLVALNRHRISRWLGLTACKI